MNDNTPRAYGETLDIKEAAAMLHLGYDAMKDLIDVGAVPALVLNKKHTVMLRDDLIAYVRDEGRKQAEDRRRKQIPARAFAPKAKNTPPRRERFRIDLDAMEARATTCAQPASTRAN